MIVREGDGEGGWRGECGEGKEGEVSVGEGVVSMKEG